MKQKDLKEFECSFCGTKWKPEKSKYKISTVKTIKGKIWKRYTSNCPNCKRETTLIEET